MEREESLAEGEIPVGSDEAIREQIQIYARELRQLYRQEKQRRQELEKEKQALEQKVRELTALNNLFQGYLRERDELLQAFHHLAQGIKKLAAEAESMLLKLPPSGNS